MNVKILDGLNTNLKIVLGIITSIIAIVTILWKPVKTVLKTRKNNTKEEIKNIISETYKPLHDNVVELNNGQKKLFEEIRTLKKDIDIDKVESIRAYLLAFVGETKNGRIHSVEEIEEWYRKYDKYERLIDKYKLSNSYLENAYIVVSNEYKTMKTIK